MPRLPPTAILVWPPWVRLLHGALAITVVASFVTHEGGGVWHERWGWAALAIAALRLLLGLVSRHPHGRVRNWFHGPAQTLRYLRQTIQGVAPRHVGHNPLGGWMMGLLLANVLLCSATGWLYTTDRFWGMEWLETLHGASGEAFVPLVVLHVLGALLGSWKQRENLVGAMVHGRKRPAEPGDLP